MAARRLIATAALLVGLLVLPTAAAADWQALPPPPGGGGQVAAADSSTILVKQACCSADFAVTSDRGGSWHQAHLTGYIATAVVGVAPDRSFRVVGGRLGESSGWVLQVFTITPAGQSQPLGPEIVDKSNAFSSGRFAADVDGSVWLPVQDGGAFDLVVVAADGSHTTYPLPDNGAEQWYPRKSAFGMRLVAAGGSGYPIGLPRRGAYRLDGGAFLPAEAYPVEFADGEFWYSPMAERASWDAGAHWGEAFDLPQFIPRHMGAPRFLVNDGVVAERFSPFLYRGGGLTLPGSGSYHGFVDSGDALVAAAGDIVYVSPLPLPPPPVQIGQIPDVARQMIARANLFRADAGLPPLIGDEAISRASLNHSAYTAANPDETEGLGAHYEKQGHPGFTGADLSARCEAAGTACFGEVMYSPVDDPVGGWLATPFHRFVPGAPQNGLVGRARRRVAGS